MGTFRTEGAGQWVLAERQWHLVQGPKEEARQEGEAVAEVREGLWDREELWGEDLANSGEC